MNKVRTICALSVATLLAGFNCAQAGLLGMPLGLGAAIRHIKLDGPSLPPMAHTQFCVRYNDDCRPRKMFRGGPVALTPEKWAQLQEVNRSVNRSIRPERNELGLAGETWIINPDRGDCNDYAVSKRHELLERGWPARVLLLGEVVTQSDEHHLVLVVRTKAGDFVLDNMTAQIKPWAHVPYRWVRVQTPGNSKLWASVGGRSA